MPKHKRKRTHNNDMYLDAKRMLTERIKYGETEVIVHYAGIPKWDITSVDGLRCTTALRTMIDIATQTDAADLNRMVRDCLDRELFSASEALARVAEPDMQTHPGAPIFRAVLLSV